jgi:basic membrane protein A
MRRRGLEAWALLLPTLLWACGGGGATPPRSADAGSVARATPATVSGASTVGLVFDVGGRGDASFNDAAAGGLERAEREFGIQGRTLTPGQGGENREELLRILASQRYGLVVAVGFAFAGPLASVARDFPDTQFAIIDATVAAPNVVSLDFASEEGSFLVGAAAGRKSRTGRLGFIGGVETDAIRRFQAGFVAGARRARPDVGVDVRYLSQPPDLSGFSDPTRAREVGLGMYQRGIDVIFHASGGSGAGLFEAAREASTEAARVWAIGVDADQYQSVAPPLRPFILTSMLKRVDVAVYDTISAFHRGEFRAGPLRFNVASGGVDYATSGGSLDDLRPELEAIKGQIIRGEIHVPATP